MLLFFFIAIIVVAFDQFTKKLAVDYLMQNEGSIILIANWLKLTYTENSGIAFGVSLGSQAVLITITALILVALLVYVVLSKNRKPAFLVTFGLILGGGIGNLIDRATVGRVVDFIHVDIYQGYLFGSWVSLWPVFNIADSAITVGACLLLLLYNRIFNP
ncbi:MULTISPECIES: signal peptidase II [Prosthecochloris]|uniref:Lipoprotein signal peptidase n=1 Tax=Prosthecochloris marina TaxID=2017681 RepID=A0A317T7I1_9CHLB|nr:MULTISPECIES: signal peptidase II [Prosthecochloris]PWW81436.1 signal peptidase II [Prosthecochloris marina]UZJ38287.1 signal peptidase II [Prosthecochloris sp. SCSIO W1103]